MNEKLSMTKITLDDMHYDWTSSTSATEKWLFYHDKHYTSQKIHENQLFGKAGTRCLKGSLCSIVCAIYQLDWIIQNEFNDWFKLDRQSVSNWCYLISYNWLMCITLFIAITRIIQILYKLRLFKKISKLAR